VLTHIYLLLGCALPVWLSGISARAGSQPPCPGVTLAALALPMAGILALGVGDAMAAIVGNVASAAGRAHTWGDAAMRVRTALCARRGPKPVAHEARPRWHGAEKTLEGTASFVGCSLLATAAMYAASRALAEAPIALIDHACAPTQHWVALAAALALSAAVETFTAGIDNAGLPLFTWVVLRLMLGAGPPAA
jgi:dolichol kinase